MQRSRSPWSLSLDPTTPGDNHRDECRLVHCCLLHGLAIPVAFPSRTLPNHAKTIVTEMAGVTGSLLIECRMALNLTQEQFGDIIARTKRSIQRYEEHGTSLLPSEVAALARAVCRVRPDLAAQIAASGDTTLEQLGIDPAAAANASATSDPVYAVVRRAAEVMGVTEDAIRPALAAAFAEADELGLDVHSVAERLSRA
jgi:transcriptional regulator with XRE-family HTH domain